MKKLLNTLFERLGYVPKKEYHSLLMFKKRVDNLYTYVYNCQIGNYCVMDIGDKFIVSLFDEKSGTHFPIKMFPFGDNKEYARLCAEELCEKLNERI